jgi:hypothetical protein
LAENASSQGIPERELFGGYAEDLSGAGIAGQGQLPTNGAQIELDRAVTRYFRVTGQFKAQFADHVVNFAPPSLPGGDHVNSKGLQGWLCPEATWRGLKRFDMFGHFLAGVSCGRESKFPKIPTATYTAWAYAPGGGVHMKISRRVSARLLGFEWITTQYPMKSPEARDHWRLDTGFAFRLGK